MPDKSNNYIKRTTMVNSQIAPCGVHNKYILASMMEIPREAFFQDSIHNHAYVDSSLLVHKDSNRYEMSPMVMGKMLHALEIKPNSDMLYIGCSSGYGVCVASKLVSSVIAVEENEDIFNNANNAVETLLMDNVAIVKNKLSQGYDKEAPYDYIFINGMVSYIPDEIFQQLRIGGKLVAIMSDSDSNNMEMGNVFLFFKSNNDTISKKLMFELNAPSLETSGFAKKKQFVL